MKDKRDTRVTACRDSQGLPAALLLRNWRKVPGVVVMAYPAIGGACDAGHGMVVGSTTCVYAEGESGEERSFRLEPRTLGCILEEWMPLAAITELACDTDGGTV